MKEITKSSYNEQCQHQDVWILQTARTSDCNQHHIASCNLEFHRFLVPYEYKCIKLNFLYHLVNIISLPLLYLLYTHTKTCIHTLSIYVCNPIVLETNSFQNSFLAASQLLVSGIYLSQRDPQSLFFCSVGSLRQRSMVYQNFKSLLGFLSPCQGNHFVGDTAKMFRLPDSVSVLVPST